MKKYELCFQLNCINKPSYYLIKFKSSYKSIEGYCITCNDIAKINVEGYCSATKITEEQADKIVNKFRVLHDNM